MTLLFEFILKAEDILKELVEEGKILDFRIKLNVNNEITIYILKDDHFNLDHFNTSTNTLKEEHSKLDFELITEQEKENDPFYTDIFSSEDKHILSSRRKLSNILEVDDNSPNSFNANIITFYSYKGGVGRSTTLASCAAYLANHYGKKIVILDCDLEAPGFTNYFLEEPSLTINKNGIVEYFIDKEFTNNQVNLEKYTWEASKEYSGDGIIYIMPAGNLSSDIINDSDILNTHKKQYLEALGRIETTNKTILENNFRELIEKIEITYSPDLIFIDSRTGFNDIFGLSAFKLSNLIVGLFGSNAQSSYGLNFFIDKLHEINTDVNAILINSIISRRSTFIPFQKRIEDYINEIPIPEDQQPIAIKTFPITRYSVLEHIGTEDDNKLDFIDLIKGKRFSDYNEIFESINEIINDINEVKSDVQCIIEEVAEESEVTQSQPKEKNTFTKKVNNEVNQILEQNLRESYKTIRELDSSLEKPIQSSLKNKIIKNLRENWPQLYGENFTPEKMKKHIFYRRSMEDIFNANKIMIVGNKGTGKTFLYEALKHPEIVKKIQARANKKEKYEFIHVIDNQKEKYLDTQKFNEFEISSESNFYDKFWVVYVWNAIMLESEERFGYKSQLEVLPIKNQLSSAKRFVEIISDSDKFITIEEDLNNLDHYLRSQREQKNLIIIFDGLDKIVPPIKWSHKIVPLIDYWRNHGFLKIIPKIFLRSDLLEKLSGIVNIKELNNQAISIEWTQEEIYGYLFKLVLSSSKKEFLRYMAFTHNISYELLKQIKTKAGNENQVPLEEFYLKPLVLSFFGKYASRDNTPRFGESYDWFYRNLKNANDTISLRPFIDLIDNSLKYSEEMGDKSYYPILPALYFAHGEARKTAVRNHIEDIAKETGNGDLTQILNFIREKKHSKPVYQTMFKSEMDSLLNNIITKSKLENNTIDDLIKLLKVNGIINERFLNRGNLAYSFALLYKYYLGLKNYPRNNRRNYHR